MKNTTYRVEERIKEAARITLNFWVAAAGRSSEKLCRSVIKEQCGVETFFIGFIPVCAINRKAGTRKKIVETNQSWQQKKNRFDVLTLS